MIRPPSGRQPTELEVEESDNMLKVLDKNEEFLHEETFLFILLRNYNKMRRIAHWLGANADEEGKQKIATMQDSKKSERKRFSALLHIFKSIEKSRGQTPLAEKYAKFFEDWPLIVPEICLSFLERYEQNQRPKAAWEDISNTLSILLEFTKYKPSLQYVCHLQELANLCLYDENHWELRQCGLKLSLHFLNINMNLDVPSHLFLCAIDFSQFKRAGSRVVLPDRSSLVNHEDIQQIYWLSAATESLKNLYGTTELSIDHFDKAIELQLTSRQKECLHFFNLVLEFSLNPPSRQSVDACQEHFTRWFAFLRHTLLFLLYPKLNTPAESLSEDWGYHEQPPPCLHFLVVHWLDSVIKNEVLRDALFQSESNYEFILNVFAYSFCLSEAYARLVYQSAKLSLSIYKDWIFEIAVPHIVSMSMQQHVNKTLSQLVILFDFSNDHSTNRNKLCREVIELLAECRNRNKHLDIVLANSYAFAEKLSKTHQARADLGQVIEPMADYLLHTIAVVSKHTTVNWTICNKVLKKWTKNSSSIVSVWRDLLMNLVEELKHSQFTATTIMKEWLQLFHVLGDPLKFHENVQNGWVVAVNQLVVTLLTPPHLAPNPNRLLKIFLFPMSKLVRRGKLQSTQEIAMKTVLSLFVESSTEEALHPEYIEHFCFLLHVGCQLPYLYTTILESISPMLDYAEVHCAIPTLLRISKRANPKSLEFFFSILSYSNFYGDVPLENFENENFAYSKLKLGVEEGFSDCLNVAELTIPALYGLTTWLLEEIQCGSGKISPFFEQLLLEKCGNPIDQIAICALNCLSFTSHFASSKSLVVIDHILKLLSGLDLDRDQVLQAMLYCLQRWLMASQLKEASVLHDIFQVIAQIELRISDLSLSSELENFVLFLSYYANNFPFKGESSELFQAVGSDSLPQCLHYAFGSSVIISVPIDPHSNRLYVRNPFGRFCLDLKFFKIFEPTSLTEEFEQIRDTLLSTHFHLNSEAKPSELTPPRLLSMFYDYLTQNHGDIDINQTPVEPGEAILELLRGIDKKESMYQRVAVNLPKEKSPFHFNRFFLGHSGILDQLVQLEPGEHFDRGLNLLDNENPRESVKIGVTYVRPFQHHERDILKADSGSEVFQLFVQSLGDVVRLNEYTGNLGGLNHDGTNGTITVVHTDWKFDVVFHIVPLMPTKPDCDQQLLKKRHVGNDIVNIVWSEDFREFRNDIIVTHLNTVLIVIYPLDSGLFRIRILKKQEIEVGPLQDGMVIPWKILPSLVKETAINANFCVRALKASRLDPKPQLRKSLIQDLVGRFSRNSSPQDHYSSLL